MSGFPIMGKKILFIPWAMIAPHEAQALNNHNQTLKRLAERGGLSAAEALDVLNDRSWNGRMFMMSRDQKKHDEHESICEDELIAMVDQFDQKEKP